jgi:DNA-binding transcriptional ArsR family regulator
MIQYMDATIQLMDDRWPLFRTDAQFRLLGELFTNPGLEMTVGALAQRLGVPQATVSREVARLAEAGLVRTPPRGQPDAGVRGAGVEHRPGAAGAARKAVRATDAHPRGAGSNPGVERAVIFGSWAARWHGRGGPVPADIDLLVIGEVDHDAVWTAAAELTRELGIAVTPTIGTPEEWEQDPTGFARQVKDGPQVDVTPDASAEQRA